MLLRSLLKTRPLTGFLPAPHLPFAVPSTMFKKAVANPVIANRTNGASEFQQRGVSGTSSAPAAPHNSFDTRPDNSFRPAPRGALAQLQRPPNSGPLNAGLKRN